MKRLIAFVYGVAAYAFVLAVFVYLIGFVGDLLVPKSIDEGMGTSMPAAVLIDLGLILLFGLQHSVMARPGFKRWWIRVVPPVVERSTFLVATGAVLSVLFWQWRPLSQTIWHVDASTGRAVLYAVFGLGWVLVLASIHLMGAAHFFGLRQVFDHLRRRETRAPEFKIPSLYQVVRHPIYVGLLMGFWATPHMTAGHLLFAGVTTLYILVGIRLEEGDLVATFGDAYRRYRERVPMLLPDPRAPGREEKGERPGVQPNP